MPPPRRAAYLGDLPRAANVTNAPALTSANASGEAPTAAEHNAVVADLAALRTTLNQALAALRAADLMA